MQYARGNRGNHAQNYDDFFLLFHFRNCVLKDEKSNSENFTTYGGERKEKSCPDNFYLLFFSARQARNPPMMPLAANKPFFTFGFVFSQV
jgi:hypothetical protein